MVEYVCAYVRVKGPMQFLRGLGPLFQPGASEGPRTRRGGAPRRAPCRGLCESKVSLSELSYAHCPFSLSLSLSIYMRAPSVEKGPANVIIYPWMRCACGAGGSDSAGSRWNASAPLMRRRRLAGTLAPPAMAAPSKRRRISGGQPELQETNRPSVPWTPLGPKNTPW